MQLRLAFLLAIILAFVPSTAFAQEASRGVLVAVDRNLVLEDGDIAEGVVIISGDGRIDGTVESFVLLIHGNLTITGEVQGQVTVIDGMLTLLESSSVKDVALIDSNLNRASGATVTGSVNQRGDFVFEGFGLVLSIYFWITLTVVMLVGALVFAAIAASQLTRATAAMTADASQVIVAGVALWIGLPIVVVLVFITVVGIPLGVAILTALPLLWALGYIVTGTRLGLWLGGMAGRRSAGHPYLAAILGVFFLQLVAWIPVVGWLIASVAGIWGGAALALVAWRAIRARPDASPPARIADAPPA